MTTVRNTSTLRPVGEGVPALPFEFDGVVRLTRVGTTYVVATVLLAVAAINTGNNALYIGVSFMLGCLLLSGLASKGGLKHLELSIDGIDEAWAGRRCEGTVRLRNRSRIWNVRDVILVSGGLAAPLLVPVIRRRSEVSIPAAFLFRRRGLVQLTSIDSYTRYPFGFILKKRRLRAGGEVVVYPALLDEPPSSDLFLPIAGEQLSSGRVGTGNEIHSFREYARGDSLRHIHWKKSASLGRWIFKQTESDASQALHVSVDPYRPPGTTDEEYERMISAAATLIYEAARKGLDVTLSLPRMTLRARQSQAAGPLFRALALVEPVYEPIAAPFDPREIAFAIRRGRDDAKSA